MAASKNPIARYLIIDRLLRRRDWVKTSEMQTAIERELGIRVTDKTIQNDIHDMQDNPTLGYYAPIEKNTSQKAWYYSDANYTITAFGLREQDLNALKFYTGALHQYKDYPVFKDVSNAIAKVVAAASVKPTGVGSLSAPMIHPELAPPMKGSEWIPTIVQALNENQKIRFVYQKHGSGNSKTMIFEPYLLKEDRHRWYVLGRSKPEGDPTWTYGLDRILELEILPETFDPRPFDFESYYEHAMGITVYDINAEEIVLSFTPKQGKYLQALPLHPTQKELLTNNEEYRISIRVKPSWEFYEKILGYGANVRVISPQSVIDQVKDIIEKLRGQYE